MQIERKFVGSQLASIDPLSWHEGMQLLPQHFQYMDRRLEHLFGRCNRQGSQRHQWGIEGFEYDESALIAGNLRVLSAVGMFSDGLMFHFESNRQGPLAYDFASAANDAPLRLALCVPASDYEAFGSAVKRYRPSITVPIADANNTDVKAVLEFITPHLVLQPYDKLKNEWIQIPVLEVRSTPSGFEALPFHPPSTQYIPDSQLASDLHAVAQCLRRAAEIVKGHPIPLALPEKYENGHGWVLSCLTAGLSTLEAQTSSRVAHPYDLYLTLCGIAANVAALAGRVPPYFKPYEHEDPGQAIAEISLFVIENIPNLRPYEEKKEAWCAIPFELSEGLWRVELNEELALKNAAIRVTLRNADWSKDVPEWINSALICFAQELDRCRELRVRGLQRTAVFELSNFNLVANDKAQYFLMDGMETQDGSRDALVIELGQKGVRTDVISDISLIVPNAQE